MPSPDQFANFLRGYQQDTMQQGARFADRMRYSDIPQPNAPGRNVYDTRMQGAVSGMQPYVNQFGTLSDQAMARAQGPTVTEGDIGGFLNPYTETVVDNTLDDLRRQTQLQNRAARSGAIAQGAYGGSRASLLEAENNRNLMDRTGAVAGNLRAQGFNTALDAAMRDEAMQRNYLRDAATMNRYGMQGQSALAGQYGTLGDRERRLQGIAQQNANRPYYFPLERAQLRQSFMSGQAPASRDPNAPRSAPSFGDNPFPYLQAGAGALSAFNDVGGFGFLGDAYGWGSDLFSSGVTDEALSVTGDLAGVGTSWLF